MDLTHSSNPNLTDSSPNSNSSDYNPYNHPLLLELFHWYFMPAMVALGTIGNMLSMCVFVRTLRKLSSSYYLAALAVSDTVVLLTIFIPWLVGVDVDFYNIPILCNIIQYLADVASFLSIWFVFAFTIERFVAVKYPFKSKYLCTVSHARIIISTLVIISLIIYSPITIMVGVYIDDNYNHPVCTVLEGYGKLVVYFHVGDMLLTCVLPVLGIIALNVVICRHVFWFARTRHRLVNGAITITGQPVVKATVGGGGGGGQLTGGLVKKSSYKLTKMLLVVSTVCVMLITPSHAMRIIMNVTDYIEMSLPKWMMELHQWTMLLYYTNFAINFLLYCMSGQNFRKAAKSIVCPFGGNAEHTGGGTIDSRTQSTGSSAKNRRNTPLRNTLINTGSTCI